VPKPVTDPNILAELNGSGGRVVSDPAVLAQLNRPAARSRPTVGGAVGRGLKDAWEGFTQPFQQLGSDIAQNYKQETQRMLRGVPTPAAAIRQAGADAAGMPRAIGDVMNLGSAPIRVVTHPLADALSRVPVQVYDPIKLSSTPTRRLNQPETQRSIEGALMEASSAVIPRYGSIHGQSLPVAGRVPVSRVSGELLAEALRWPGVGISEASGMMTGAGGQAVREAAAAGFNGGTAKRVFAENMRDKTPTTDILPPVEAAFELIAKKRSDAYAREIAPISQDQTVLGFTDIKNAIQGVKNRGFFKGEAVDPKAADIWNEIDAAVAYWESLDPAEYHTPMGMDALKRQIQSIAKAAPERSPARNAADTAVRAVRTEIIKQAPDYGKVMKAYERDSNEIDDIAKALSVGGKANTATTLSKLASAIKADTSLGAKRRNELAQLLVDNGAHELFPALAGQALSPILPRGLARWGDSALAGSLWGVAHNPVAAGGYLLGSSPRVVGEAALGAGSAVRKAKQLADLLRKMGITPELVDPNFASGAAGAASQNQDQGQ